MRTLLHYRDIHNGCYYLSISSDKERIRLSTLLKRTYYARPTREQLRTPGWEPKLLSYSVSGPALTVRIDKKLRVFSIPNGRKGPVMDITGKPQEQRSILVQTANNILHNKMGYTTQLIQASHTLETSMIEEYGWEVEQALAQVGKLHPEDRGSNPWYLLQAAAFPCLREFYQQGRMISQLPVSTSGFFRAENPTQLALQLLGHSGRRTVRDLSEALFKGCPAFRVGGWQGAGFYSVSEGGLPYSTRMERFAPPQITHENHENFAYLSFLSPVLAHLFRKRLPVDYLQEILRFEWNSPYGTFPITQDILAETIGKDGRRTFRRLLENYSPRRWMRLLENANGSIDDIQELRDTLRLMVMSQQRGDVTLPREPRTFEELHNHVVRDYNRHQRWNPAPWRADPAAPLANPAVNYTPPAPVEEINLLPLWEKFDGIEYEKYKIVVPRHADTLANWGNEMHHCIAGYARAMHEHRCLLLGVLEDGKLKYNLEIRQGRIVQFRGFANATPPLETMRRIEWLLLNRGVQVGDHVIWTPLYNEPLAKEATNTQGGVVIIDEANATRIAPHILIAA